MDSLDLKFLITGAAMFILGIGLGIFMAMTHDYRLAPVHAHTNLIGFVSLSLFGMAYKIYPQLQKRKLAKAHFFLSAPAALMFPPGIVLAALWQQPLLAVIASLMWLAGAIVFLIQLIGLAGAGAGTQAQEPALVAAE
jgi:cbb3-type cytochrome oxidase subunit 1